MTFSDQEVERYARHLVLREIGGPGQQKLKAAKVLLVGVGGLGAPAGLYLAAAGEPRPPAPTSSALAAFSFCCPGPPTSRNTRWRA